MGRSKKRKTSHHSSSQKGGELSQAEIWDDSALLQSWNDALAEYEYYHSIHARGEDVEEVLRQAEAAEEEEAAAVAAARQSAQGDNMNSTIEKAGIRAADDDIEDGEVDESGDNDSPVDPEQHPNQDTAKSNGRHIVESNGSLPISNSSTATSQDKIKSHQIPNGDGDIIQPTHGPAGVDLTDPQGAGSVDQTLENIKMAYYWAGYYSGLHDGQKQARAQNA